MLSDVFHMRLVLGSTNKPRKKSLLHLLLSIVLVGLGRDPYNGL